MPFSTEQFFEVFEKYNSAVFPVQLLIIILGVAGLFLLHFNLRGKNRSIGSYLGLLWIWVGVVYHITFFTEINPVAKVFGVIFILQGSLILLNTYKKDFIVYSFFGNLKDYAGYFLVIFGLIVYPLIGFWIENSWTRVISPGLPCPTTILTFGFFLLSSKNFPKYLLIIPTLWAIVGVSAAVEFGIWQDLMILVSATLAIYFLLLNKKRAEKIA